MLNKAKMLAVLCVVAVAAVAVAEVSDFENPTLPAESYWNGSFLPETDIPVGEWSVTNTTTFASGNTDFSNSATTWLGGGTSWKGWSYSNTTDTTTQDILANQYSAYGTALGSADNQYGVYYQTTGPSASFGHATEVSGMWITNTTCAYLSMRDGDSYAKKFTVEDNDWFLLTIEGFDGGGDSTGTFDFYLADFRNYGNGQSFDYIVDQWTWVDLTDLGDNVESLQFTLTSSDVGTYGMNTPAYFAMDALVHTPEPATMSLLALGGLALIRRRRRA